MQYDLLSSHSLPNSREWKSKEWQATIEVVFKSENTGLSLLSEKLLKQILLNYDIKSVQINSHSIVILQILILHITLDKNLFFDAYGLVHICNKHIQFVGMFVLNL